MSENTALLVVSFGTSYEETRKKTIDVMEEDLRAAFPQKKFYRAWTSRRIVKKLKETRGLSYDNVREAMERMIQEGVTEVLVQPTHMLAGEEFEETKKTILEYRSRFAKIEMGAPLLGTEADVKVLAEAIEGIFSDVKNSEMLALMGHGSAHTEFPVYTLLGECFRKDGFLNFCVGTVEYEPGIAPVLARVKAEKPERVYLSPLLVVAGDHALNDMSGDEPDSWKSQIEKEGVEAVCIIRGMGEYQTIRNIYVEHAQNAKPL